MLDLLIFVSQLVLISFCVYVYFILNPVCSTYIRYKNVCSKYNMELDELLKVSLPQDETSHSQPECNGIYTDKREKLIALSVGGKIKPYLGKEYSSEQILSMSNEEIDKLYNRYEAKLGATITKTLGSAALNLFAIAATKYLSVPEVNQHELITDLESDPFVSHALNTITCNLYYRFGMFLAPITAAITTVKYCQFKDTTTLRNNNGNDECRTAESTGTRESRGSD